MAPKYSKKQRQEQGITNLTIYTESLVLAYKKLSSTPLDLTCPFVRTAIKDARDSKLKAQEGGAEKLHRLICNINKELASAGWHDDETAH